MRFLLKDLADSIRGNRWLYALIAVSQLLGAVCLLTVYGIYAGYAQKQKQMDIDSMQIEVSLEDVSAAKLRECLPELLEKLGSDVDFLYLLTGYGDRNINCHFTYHNGKYGLAESVQNPGMAEGRFYDERDFGSEEKVIVMGGDYECGSKVEIGGQSFTVIGCTGVEYQKNASWMWIGQVPESLEADLIIFTFQQLPTYDSYMQIQTFFQENFMDKARMQEFEPLDMEELISIRTMIFMAAAIGTVIALNTGILYGYLIRKRRKEMAVFAIAGASRKTRFYLLFGEIGVVNLVLLIAAAAGFFLLIDPMVHDMYQNSQIGYGFRPYALLMTSYYLCVMAILGVIVWFMNRIKIKDMMRRIRND